MSAAHVTDEGEHYRDGACDSGNVCAASASLMDWLKSVHFYRKVPIDLTEATISGGAISLL